MSLPGLGRTDLLKLLASLPEREWLSAVGAAGFEVPPKRPPSRPPKVIEPAPLPYSPNDLPDLPFWRIVAERPLTAEEWPTEPPAWLAVLKPWGQLPQSDPDVASPQAAALAPLGRQARFLRHQLAEPGRTRDIDLTRLCRQLAERRLPVRLPRLARPRWPGRIHLVVDLSPPLRPFRADILRWSGQLRTILGQRVERLVTLEGHPGALERPGMGACVQLRPAGDPLIILSDAGLYAQDGPRYRRWRAFGAACARTGVRPLLLAPCPPRYLSREIAAHFRCVLLERGMPLRPWRPRPIGSVGPWTPPPAPSVGPLLAALAGGARTEAPLLRALRLQLAGYGADIGSEYELWNHLGVASDELACALRPDERAPARRVLQRLPQTLRRALEETRRSHNRHLSPLIQMEEGLLQADPEIRRAGLTKAGYYAATLYRAGAADLQQPLAAAIAALARRRPELVAALP